MPSKSRVTSFSSASESVHDSIVALEALLEIKTKTLSPDIVFNGTKRNRSHNGEKASLQVHLPSHHQSSELSPEVSIVAGMKKVSCSKQLTPVQPASTPRKPYIPSSVTQSKSADAAASCAQHVDYQQRPLTGKHAGTDNSAYSPSFVLPPPAAPTPPVPVLNYASTRSVGHSSNNVPPYTLHSAAARTAASAAAHCAMLRAMNVPSTTTVDPSIQLGPQAIHLGYPPILSCATDQNALPAMQQYPATPIVVMVSAKNVFELSGKVNNERVLLFPKLLSSCFSHNKVSKPGFHRHINCFIFSETWGYVSSGP